MRELVRWLDHVVEHPNRYKEKEIEAGVIELEKDPGEILVQGTPMSAKNFNTMDLAAFEAMLMAADGCRMISILQNTVNGLTGIKIPVTLTNSKVYPHNNSKKTIQIPIPRNTMDYTIECEVESVEGGAAGELVITDKLRNGFKLAHTGSATKVVVNCYVRGGI